MIVPSWRGWQKRKKWQWEWSTGYNVVGNGFPNFFSYCQPFCILHQLWCYKLWASSPYGPRLVIVQIIIECIKHSLQSMANKRQILEILILSFTLHASHTGILIDISLAHRNTHTVCPSIICNFFGVSWRQVSKSSRLIINTLKKIFKQNRILSGTFLNCHSIHSVSHNL